MKLNALFAAAVAALLPLAAFADGPALYKLDGPHSALTYKIVHKLHEVEGTSKAVQGAAVVKPGMAQVQFRADISSFDSGNANRDAHMKETVEAVKYPQVALKGVLENFVMPTKFPATVDGNLKAELTFHGQTNPITVPVKIEFPDASHAHATTKFDVSLDQFKVDRPSLMFVKIDDACHITGDLNFTK